MFSFTSIIVVILLQLVVVQGKLGEGDVVVQPPAGSTGPEIALVLIQGADIKPETYVPLTNEIQKIASANYKMWVGIPEFIGDAAEPLVLDRGINRILDSMANAGMNTSTLIMAGHSLGGAMVQLWSNENKEKVSAQILMGAFLTRTWKTDYVFSYTVPTLTIGGELDGLARVTRMAEAYYTQIQDPTQDITIAKTTFPVTVIEGVTHMQFASGTPPDLVQQRDLIPEVTYEEAHSLIATDFMTFVNARLSNGADAAAVSTLNSRLAETESFIAPILDSLKMEGYHNFRPPCLCTTDVCEEMPNCTAACPWTNEYSQVGMMGTDLDGVTIANADSFHNVWETEPTVHLPSVQNSCESPDGCTLKTTTITQAVYHNGEQLEIWKKTFDVAWLDFGFFPVSAVELRTKLNSRQSIYFNAGIEDADFDELDGGHTQCAAINQASIDWANDRVGASTASRFSTNGQPYITAADKDVCPAGPCWIWEELHYDETADGNNVAITSEQFSTALDFYLPKTAGFHYCKVLSPARAMEWMYVDGLRAKYSLASQA